MQYFCQSAIAIQQGQSGSFFVNLPSESAPSGPTVGNDEEPFNLTGVTEVIASFPNIVNEKKSLSQVSVVGAAGAGKLQVNYSALDSLNMQANPVPTQNQDLQVMVILNGVAQVEGISLTGGPTAGLTYSAILNGVTFSYTAVTGDTSQTVMQTILTAMNAYATAQAALLPPIPWNISGAIIGSGNTANILFTSTLAGLPFTLDVNSQPNWGSSHGTANAGTIAVFLFKFALNIQPQSYAIT